MKILNDMAHLRLFSEPVPKDAPQRGEAVAPADLLALLVGSTGVAARQLVDSITASSDAGREFGFEAEAVLLEQWGDLVNDFAAADLVAGLHVGEIQIREAVGHRCEKAIAEIVPEVEHSMRLVAQKSASEHNVGFTFNNRVQQHGVLGRVVFQVGVLNDHKVALHGSEAGANSRSLALILLVINKRHSIIRQRAVVAGRFLVGTLFVFQLLEQIASSVLAAIIDQDDLFANRHLLHSIKQPLQRLSLVVNGNHD